MKTYLSVVLSSVIYTAILSSAMAEDTEKAVTNDRFMVNKGIAQYDINPFVDQQRVMRNDRVSKDLGQMDTENKADIVCNDRVIDTESTPES